MNGKISNYMEVASIRRYEFTAGREKGIEVLDCDNGRIRFLLNISKACDMMQLYHEGQNVSFISKNGFSAKGAEVPFGKRFEGGMIYTCGIDSLGKREGFEMHGTLHNISAEIVEASCDDDGIAVEAVIRDTALFDRDILLRRRITSPIGASFVKVEDTLYNEGNCDIDYGLLYHVNIGYPMLDEGARIEADVISCEARTEWTQKHLDAMHQIIAPVPNMPELCFYPTLAKPEISLVNEKLGKRLTVSYSGDTLTDLVLWKSMGSGGYALGFEPSTSTLGEGFEYKVLRSKESVCFEVKISVDHR